MTTLSLREAAEQAETSKSTIRPAIKRAACRPRRRGNGARDWPEKTEDWQGETGRCAQSLLLGDNSSLKTQCGFAAREAEVAL